MKVVTIGRSKENNDIVINDEKVSRNHLQMIMDDQGNYSVLDLNSTNGTFVNGRRITGQVPLKTTDELRIGNTVLSWQCYFDSQVNTGTLHPKHPQPPVIQDPPHEPISNPAPPKRWLIYVIIGAVVLLLVGSGIGWMIYKQKHDNIDVAKAEAETRYKEAEADYQTARADSAVAAKDLAVKDAEAARAQAVADSMARIAAESKSKHDQVIAEEMKRAAEAAKTAQKNAEQTLKEKKQAVEEKAEEVKRLDKKLQEIRTQLEQTRTDLKEKENENRALKEENDKLKKSSKETRDKQFRNYLKQMRGYEEEFCNQQHWNKTGGAKKAIENKYKNASETDQQKIIEAMEAFVNSIESDFPASSKGGTKESLSQEKPKTGDKESSTQDTSNPKDKGTAKPDTLNKQ